MSPMISDAEEEDDHGGGHGESDAEHKGGKGRNKKKWRRKKGAAEATADGNTEASHPRQLTGRFVLWVAKVRAYHTNLLPHMPT